MQREGLLMAPAGFQLHDTPHEPLVGGHAPRRWVERGTEFHEAGKPLGPGAALKLERIKSDNL